MEFIQRSGRPLSILLNTTWYTLGATFPENFVFSGISHIHYDISRHNLTIRKNRILIKPSLLERKKNTVKALWSYSCRVELFELCAETSLYVWSTVLLYIYTRKFKMSTKTNSVLKEI